MQLTKLVTHVSLLSLSAASLTKRQAPIQCKQCNHLPFTNPQCDITTSCVAIPDTLHTYRDAPPNYCACRAGYKATNVGADPTAQWRLRWGAQGGRVFVRPEVVCDTLCDDWQLGEDGCQEVHEYAQCL
jgi:hypothetical protein